MPLQPPTSDVGALQQEVSQLKHEIRIQKSLAQGTLRGLEETIRRLSTEVAGLRSRVQALEQGHVALM